MQGEGNTATTNQPGRISCGICHDHGSEAREIRPTWNRVREEQVIGGAAKADGYPYAKWLVI